MHPIVSRVAQEMSVDEMFPELTEDIPGWTRLPPLLRAVLGAQDLRWQGTIFVRDDTGQMINVLRAQDGWLVVAPGESTEHIREAALAVCEADNLNVTLVAASSMSASTASPGADLLDPLVVADDILRAGLADSAVFENIAAIGSKALKLHAEVNPNRYELTRDETAVMNCLRAGPQTLAELVRNADVPRRILQRFVFLLRVSHAVDVVPVWLRTTEVGDIQTGIVRNWGASSYREEPNTLGEPGNAPDGFIPRESACVPARQARTLPMGSRAPAAGTYLQHRPEGGSDDMSAGPEDIVADTLDETFEITPKDRADYHFRAAEVLLERGYVREAVFEAQKAMRLCPPTPAQRAFYATLLYARGGLTPRVEACIREHVNQALTEDPHCERARSLAVQIVRKR